MRTMEKEAIKKSSPGHILKETRDKEKDTWFLLFKVRNIDSMPLQYFINLVILGIFIGLWIAYCLLIRYEARYHHSGLGFINTAVVMVTDLVVICWGLISRTGHYITPFKIVVVLAVTRILLCIWPDYWILMHSIVFLLLLCMFVTAWILKNIHVTEKKGLRNRKQKDLIDQISKCDKLKHDLSKEVEGINAEDLVSQTKNSYLWMAVETIPIFLMFAAFVAYGIIIWAEDFDRAYAKDIKVDGQFLNQGIFVGLSYALFICYVLMAIWFRLFQLYEYEVKPLLLLLAIVAYAAIVIIGIIYGNIILNDVGEGPRVSIITAFCMLPFYILTIWIFYGIWRHNHYNFYHGAKVTRVKSERREDSNGELIAEGGELRMKEKVKISRTPYRLIPTTFNDVVVLCTFWLNVVGLFVAFLICIIVYDPKWVIAFVWAWAMLLEFGAFGIIRFYHAGFGWRDRWIWN